MLIRPTRVTDVAANFACHSAAVWGKASAHYDERILKAWSPGPTPERIAGATAEIEDGSIISRIAELDGTVVGFGIVIPAKNEFRALYVKPMPIRGIGTDLCQDLLKEARQRQCTYLELSSSLNAVGFYQKMGAKIMHPITHTLAGPVEMPAMRMRFDFE